MKLSEVKKILSTLENVEFQLENGTFVPEHFHVTEVGMITKNFIDCGGVIRTDIVEKKFKSKEDKIKALRERIYDLEGIKDFQQDVIIDFERVTGKELSKKFLPERLANEIQKKKKKLKD